MDNQIVRYVRLARGAQAGGFYGLAKLLWALAFSAEIRASSAAGIPRGADLLTELDALRQELQSGAADEALMRAFEAGVRGVRANETIAFADIPDVRVSRTDGHIVLGDVPSEMSGGDDVLDMRLVAPIHYFEPLAPEQVIAALREFPVQLTGHLEVLSESQMEAHPFEGEWSIRELIHHFAQAQALLHDRLKQMLAADNPSLMGMAVWAMRAGEMTTADLLCQYRESRAQTLDLLSALPADGWWRRGTHGEFGPVTILSQATYFARHERNHVPQLMALLRAVSAV
jgi:hypothetical protein